MTQYGNDNFQTDGRPDTPRVRSARPQRNDWPKYGAVLVFRDGVSQEQAERALRQLGDLLERPPHVQGYNPQYGEPVWYIP